MKPLVIPVAWLLCSPLLGVFPAAPSAAQITPQIVNGQSELAEPTTAALLQGLDPATAIVACSATLIGCDTAITAGHCFNANADLRRTLFFQHAGFYPIESAVRHPVYAACYDQGGGTCSSLSITRQEDIAVIKLATPVSGIAPSPINTTQTPGSGTPGRIVGFGRDPLSEPSVFYQNPGIKRSGSMALTACQDPSLSPYDVLCWDPSELIGAPGENASTCNVDSGGPLFIDRSGVRVVAGLTKGALNQGPDPCIPPVEVFDTNVFRHHPWIQQTVAQLGGIPLSVTDCGSLPRVDASAVAGICSDLDWFEGESPRVCGFPGELSSSLLQQQHAFQVPLYTQRLRVTMNGTSRTTNPVDVSLYVRAGAPPTPSVFDCAGVATGNFAACEFDQPQAGTWYALAVRVAGTVAYQITATEFAPAPPAPDADGDGVDDALDNCTLLSNTDQQDIDVDGCGDVCDGDFDNSGVVEGSDFSLFKAAYLTESGHPGYDPLADMDGNGMVDGVDFAYFKAGYAGPPGPSGLPPELKTPVACP
jgi:hypothetical protein